MDITAIAEAINELENSSTTAQNVRELASLYIVKQYYKNASETIVDASESVSAELDDILPRFKYYIQLKRKYQLHETTKDLLIISMCDVCKELKDFIFALYQNTETAEERKLIKGLIDSLQTNL